VDAERERVGALKEPALPVDLKGEGRWALSMAVPVGTWDGAAARDTANVVGSHTTAAEELAAAGRWEAAYQHLRAAVRLLHGQPTSDELERLRRETAEAREQSRRDSLTASYNRRYLDERLATLLADPASRSSDGIAIALVDVDHFKQVNDVFGHQFGDRVLQRIVAELDRGLPEAAFCARYGGEEFALVLPGRDLAAALRVCEAARRRIDHYSWADLAGGLYVTVSIGVAHSSDPLAEVDRLVGAADALLYAAKHSGRNAVAFRDEHTGLVRLAGAAGGRRDVKQAVRAPRPGCDRCGVAP
jgi:diguanylate cyclase (GGDEF)-like protein